MQSDHRYSLAPWKPVALDDLVRLGRENDGGYVLPRRCIDATRALVGLGIFDDWSFEEAFSAANSRTFIIGVDGTVSYRQFRSRAGEAKMRAIIALARLRLDQSRAQFRKARHWMSRARDLDSFFNREGRSFHSKLIADIESEWEVTWSTLLESEPLLGRATGPLEIFVKMDIESSEYRVLEDVIRDHEKINGMVVEFHDVDVHWGRFRETIQQMSDYFAVAHIHGNNFHPLIRGTSTPRALEVSFVNRQLLDTPVAPSMARYPIVGLDRPCDPTRRDYAIEF